MPWVFFAYNALIVLAVSVALLAPEGPDAKKPPLPVMLGWAFVLFMSGAQCIYLWSLARN